MTPTRTTTIVLPGDTVRVLGDRDGDRVPNYTPANKHKGRTGWVLDGPVDGMYAVRVPRGRDTYTIQLFRCEFERVNT